MILDGRKNTCGILEGLMLGEIAKEVNLEESHTAEENQQNQSQDEPLFDEALVPLVIDSQGLW